MLLIKKMIALSLFIVLATEAFLSEIFVYIGIIPQACCSFLPFKSLLYIPLYIPYIPYTYPYTYPGIPTQNFWMLFIKKMIALSLFIVLATEAFLSEIFVYIGIIPQACCSFLPFKSLYTYPSSRFIPLATKKLL